MKNIFIAFLMLFFLSQCSKQEFSQTTDSFKKADSLFTRANDGLKTLDSISKSINDSDGIAKKIIIPQIEKQTKRIDSTLKTGSWQIDSINKEIEKITKHVKTGTEVAKTLDSASQLLQKGENAIAVLSKTADRILKQTKKKAENPSLPKEQEIITPPSNVGNSPLPEEQRQIIPLIKTTALEIEVENLSDAKALLRQQLRDSNGRLVSENYSISEGIRQEEIQMKIPMRDYDYFVQSISSQLGEIISKNATSAGGDLVRGSVGTVEIKIIEQKALVSQTLPPENEKNSTEEEADKNFSAKSSEAFKSGFDTLGKIFLALLPFWPVFLIAAVILVIVWKKRKKTELHDRENSPTIPPAEDVNDDKSDAAPKTEEAAEPDYSKYLPKK